MNKHWISLLCALAVLATQAAMTPSEKDDETVPDGYCKCTESYCVNASYLPTSVTCTWERPEGQVGGCFCYIESEYLETGSRQRKCEKTALGEENMECGQTCSSATNATCANAANGCATKCATKKAEATNASRCPVQHTEQFCVAEYCTPQHVSEPGEGEGGSEDENEGEGGL